MKHYLKKKKRNTNKFRSNTLITTINFHCDFEQGISNAAKKVFPNINIKYCVWKNNNDIYIYYKAISNLPFINPNYIFDIYIIIKRICQKKKV